MATALKKKKVKYQIKASSRKKKKKKGKKIKGKCKLMEASITRWHKPQEAVTVTAHTYCWEKVSFESVRGDSGMDLGYRGMVGPIWGLVLTSCPKLCSGNATFLAYLIAMSPAKEKMRL